MYELAYRCANCDAIFKEEIPESELRKAVCSWSICKSCDDSESTPDKEILEDKDLLGPLFMWGREYHWCGPKTVSYGKVVAITKLEE